MDTTGKYNVIKKYTQKYYAIKEYDECYPLSNSWGKKYIDKTSRNYPLLYK